MTVLGHQISTHWQGASGKKASLLLALADCAACARQSAIRLQIAAAAAAAVHSAASHRTTNRRALAIQMSSAEEIMRHIREVNKQTHRQRSRQTDRARSRPADCTPTPHAEAQSCALTPLRHDMAFHVSLSLRPHLTHRWTTKWLRWKRLLSRSVAVCD